VETRTVTIHGHDVSVMVGGTPGDGRPVLLLVHGMAGSAATWREVIEPLSQRYTVIAPDLLGHGRSDKPRHDYSLGSFASLLRDLLISFDVERATIVGQSLGGGICLQFAYQFPERCERLVLVDSGGLGRDVSPMLRALAVPGSEYLMPLLFPSFARTAGNKVSRWLFDRGLRAPSIQEQWRSYVSLTYPDFRNPFIHTLRAVVDVGGQTVSAHDRLYLAEQMPTLIVWGAKDHIIPVEHAHAAHEAMPGSRLEIFDGSSHFPQTEEPGRFVDVLSSFVDSTEPAENDPLGWSERLTRTPTGT
jgi:pimeloyl-ACP methyl ester carboxylesterase